MGFMTIPDWNMAGYVPPIDTRSGNDGTSCERSPYRVSMQDFVKRFGGNEERRKMLSGFLNLRSELYECGIIKGIQWIDGSFLEDVENTQGRYPKDIDVVTHAYLPDGKNQMELFHEKPNLFDQKKVKNDYYVDHYMFFIPCSPGSEFYFMRQVSYWYSMWSHRRDGTWKGFAEIELDQNDDQDARKQLFQQGDGGEWS